MRTTLVVLFLAALHIGCGSSLNPVSSPTVAASGLLPFPVIPSGGGTVILEPGTYACPASIPTSTHIIGHGSLMSDEIYDAARTFSHFEQVLKKTGSIKIVRVICTVPLVLKNVADVQISGVIFDFQGLDAGLIFDSVSHSEFSIGIYHNGDSPALTLLSTNGNNFGNHFPRLVTYDSGGGMFIKGSVDDPGGPCCFVVTGNVFDSVEIVGVKHYGIDVAKWADTNWFHNTQILALNPNASAGVVLNDQGADHDVDADGNMFSELYVNAEDTNSPIGCGVRFRGTTLGNFVFMSFAILPDATKFCIEPGFHTDELHKLNEFPKAPAGVAPASRIIRPY